MKEQTFRISIYVFIISILLCLFYFFFGGQILNDAKARQIEKGMSDMALPTDMELVEVSSYVGNTSGTGNHIEIWAGILIRTDLDEDTVRGCFDGFTVLAVPNDLKYLDYIQFQTLNENHTANGYYVIGKYYDSFTQMDLRGH